MEHCVRIFWGAIFLKTAFCTYRWIHFLNKQSGMTEYQRSESAVLLWVWKLSIHWGPLLRSLWHWSWKLSRRTFHFSIQHSWALIFKIKVREEKNGSGSKQKWTTKSRRIFSLCVTIEEARAMACVACWGLGSFGTLNRVRVGLQFTPFSWKSWSSKRVNDYLFQNLW